jgi:hypothetical protein
VDYHIFDGLRVTVQGDLPTDVMERISNAVRRAVLNEVAELDLTRPLHERALNDAKDGIYASGVLRSREDDGGTIDLTFGPTLGIVLKSEES